MVNRKSYFYQALDVLTFINNGETVKAELMRSIQISKNKLTKIIGSLIEWGLLENHSGYKLTSKGENIVNYYLDNSDSLGVTPLILTKPS
jgi:predicted transcriptional regulator